MQRVNNILQNVTYRKYVKMNENCEQGRIFCCHNMQHFLDVARIAYIVCLEQHIDLEKDIVYGAALLHDIGRWKEYEEGIPHELAGVELAEEILMSSGYNIKETKIILQAIGNHRNKDNAVGSLSEIIYKSDKLSRSCFNCMAEKQCNWSEEKKNLNIKY